MNARMWCVGLLGLAAACGDGTEPLTIRVTITNPALVGVLDEAAGAWQVLPTTPGVHEATVGGPYRLTRVCDDGNFAYAYQTARSLADPLEIDLSCGGGAAAPHQITGTMVQPGAVHLGFRSSSGAATNWPFGIRAAAGTVDLVAVSDAAIAIRRDLAIQGALDLGAIDVAQEGEALVATPVTASAAGPGEQLNALVSLSTGPTLDVFVYHGALATAHRAPDSILRAGDQQTLEVSASATSGRSMTYRSLTRDLPGTGAQFTLPDPLGAPRFAIEGTQLVASWDALPPHDKVGLRIAPFGAPVRAQQLVEATAAYVSELGATHLAFDASTPGFDAAWLVDPARSTRSLSADGADADGVRVSSLEESVLP
ncbi:MAG: hypothetical protein ACTHU0_40080 [Kofleriaceae bacterium]